MAEESGLMWGIRTPFTDYVQRTGGTVSVGAPASWQDGQFVFPRSAERPADPNRLEFGGEVLFQGHGGFLRLSIADPWLERRADGGLKVTVDVDGERVPVGSVVSLVDGSAAAEPRNSVLALELTEEGEPLFGGVYPAGTELDPIVLALPAELAGSVG